MKSTRKKINKFMIAYSFGVDGVLHEKLEYALKKGGAQCDHPSVWTYEAGVKETPKTVFNKFEPYFQSGDKVIVAETSKKGGYTSLGSRNLFIDILVE